MARKQHMTIKLSNEGLLAQQRHTDWQIAHEQGRTRNGRAYVGHRVHGAKKTKKGRSRNACRGRVEW